ncbi:hypothetical protein [Corynebacterium sp.]|uniref:hypothetical protein n=1 Tax=Corynebacterium sp. TaxID=1720 RepID=UPI0026DD4E38|nr:hypothetical protein [Corynebacterium sp.]MDO5076891.1 hypothetical protein [Corynebacterium sp.]
MSTDKQPAPSFKETFIAVGQQTLSKQRQDYVYSVGKLVTGLMVLAGVLYLWFPIAAVVALVCAIIAMWGRWILTRQVTRDLAEMRAAKTGYTTTGDPDYARFIRLRGEQMLADNKALTPLAKAEIGDLIAWAAERAPRSEA